MIVTLSRVLLALAALVILVASVADAAWAGPAFGAAAAIFPVALMVQAGGARMPFWLSGLAVLLISGVVVVLLAPSGARYAGLPAGAWGALLLFGLLPLVVTGLGYAFSSDAAPRRRPR